MTPRIRLATLVLVSLLVSLTAACGGAPTSHPDDEVSATWTSGDDAPLEESGAAAPAE